MVGQEFQMEIGGGGRQMTISRASKECPRRGGRYCHVKHYEETYLINPGSRCKGVKE